MAEYETTIPEPRNYLDGVHESLEPEPAPDPEAFGSNHTEIERAAEELSSSRTGRNQVIERQFHDGEDLTKAAPGHKTVSPEFAADSLKAIRAQEAAQLQAEIDEATSRVVDDFRGEQPPSVANDEARAAMQQPQLEPQPEYAPPESNPELDSLLQGLAPEGRTAFLNNYNNLVQQAQYQVSAQYSEALQRTAAVQQQLQQGVQNAGQVAIAGLLVSFPELNGVTAEQLPAALQMLERSNPQRHQQLANHMSQVRQTIQVAQQQAQQEQVRQHAVAQQRQQQQQEQWQRWAAREDERVGDVAPAIQQEIVKMVEEAGIDRQELLQLWNSNPVLRHSAFQAALRDAALYRMSKRAIPQAVSRPVPQVQRPGTISDEGRDYSEYAQVANRYRGQSLNPRQAAELVIAKRARR